jgi:hypothetical protein
MFGEPLLPYSGYPSNKRSKYQIALGSSSYDAKGPFASFACFLNPVNSGRKHTKEI